MLNVGVMVLDAELKVIRFTGLCAEIFELQEHDIGRKVGNVGGRPEFVRPSDLAEKAMQEGAVQTASGVYQEEALTLTAVPFGAREEGRDRGVVLIYSGPLMSSVGSRGGSGADA